MLKGAGMSEPSTSSQETSSPCCPNCGGQPKKHRGKYRTYCSHQCWAEFKRRPNMHSCRQCGAEFYRAPGHASRHGGPVFCSSGCWSKYQTGKNNAAWRGGPVTMTCSVCASTFQLKPSEAKRRNTCSHACYGKIRAERIRKLPPTARCQHCGAVFNRRSHKPKFCSRKCASDAHANRVRGSGNGRYVHGEHERTYGAGWTISHRDSIRARDGCECRLCGMTQDEHGKKLCVHHIDYDKDNMAPSNLITVCRFCHGRMHGRPAERERWKKELSALSVA